MFLKMRFFICVMLCTVCMNHMTSADISENSFPSGNKYNTQHISVMSDKMFKMLLDEMNALKEQTNRLQTDLNQLKVANYKLTTQNRQNNKTFERLHKEIQGLKSVDNDLIHHLRGVDNKLVHHLKDVDNKLQNQMLYFDEGSRVVRQELDELKAAQNTFIAFTAFSTQSRSYAVNERILFDGVVSNYGGSYDATTSLFTCPATAYYWFSMYTYTTDTILWASISVNGVYTVGLDSADNNNAASNSVVILCESGQAVEVICTYGGTLFGSSIIEERFSSFSGVLLQILA